MSHKSVNIEQLSVGRNYAMALWNLALAKGSAQTVVEEIEAIVIEILDPHPQLEDAFSALGREHRQGLVDRLFQGKVSELVYNFLGVLNRNDRLDHLRATATALTEQWHKHQGLAAVEVESAVPLSPTMQQRLEAMITQRFGVTPKLDVKVKPELLGGLSIRIGDMVYDDTLRSQLNHLQSKILTRREHEIQSR